MATLIISFLGGIAGALFIEFLKPFVMRISSKFEKIFLSELNYLDEIESKLSNYKKYHSFYKNKLELEKISDMLKKYFTEGDKQKILDLQIKIEEKAEEYEKISPEIRDILNYSEHLREYFDFLQLVLNRQKNKPLNKFKNLLR